jgi:hypothetical protein
MAPNVLQGFIIISYRLWHQRLHCVTSAMSPGSLEKEMGHGRIVGWAPVVLQKTAPEDRNEYKTQALSNSCVELVPKAGSNKMPEPMGSKGAGGVHIAFQTAGAQGVLPSHGHAPWASAPRVTGRAQGARVVCVTGNECLLSGGSQGKMLTLSADHQHHLFCHVLEDFPIKIWNSLWEGLCLRVSQNCFYTIPLRFPSTNMCKTHGRERKRDFSWGLIPPEALGQKVQLVNSTQQTPNEHGPLILQQLF